METAKIADVLCSWAEAQPLIREVYIFGSRARDEHRPDSDIDVAVKVNKAAGDYDEYTTWVFESDRLEETLAALLPLDVDLEWYDPEETPHVHAEILRSSLRVY
ncbi:MAG: nucleotidyltransferase domain-containing protein [Pseudomonadota bacterium]